jgi:hypothetical protein
MLKIKAVLSLGIGLLLTPMLAQAVMTFDKTTKNEGSSTDLFYMIRIPLPGGSTTVRTTYSYTLAGDGNCVYKAETYNLARTGEDNNSGPTLLKSDISNCYYKYKKTSDRKCLVLSKADDVTAEVPYPRCFGYANGMRNGWEVVRSELGTSWQLEIPRDVRILEKNYLSENIPQVDPEMKKRNGKNEINCEIGVRTTADNERNLVPRTLIIEKIWLKREIDHVEFNYVFLEKANPAKPEVTQVLKCKVPNNYEFVLPNEYISLMHRDSMSKNVFTFDSKVQNIDIEPILVDIVKSIGFKLTPPPTQVL